MLRRTVHATITGWEATQWTWLFRVYYGTVAQRSPQRPDADRTDSLWSFMHCTLLFFLPHKKKRIRTETEETFTVVSSYSSTSLPVKKLDKDLSIFLIFQKEIRPGTDRRHPWSTAEILQNLLQWWCRRIIPARHAENQLMWRHRRTESLIAATRDKRRSTTLTTDLIIR